MHLAALHDFHSEYVLDKDLYHLINGRGSAAMCTKFLYIFRDRVEEAYNASFARGILRDMRAKYPEETVQNFLKTRPKLLPLMGEIEDDIQHDRGLAMQPVCVYIAERFAQPSEKLRLQTHERFHAKMRRHMERTGWDESLVYSGLMPKSQQRAEFAAADLALADSLDQFGKEIAEGLAYIAYINRWTAAGTYYAAIEESLARVAEYEAAYLSRNPAWIWDLKHSHIAAVQYARRVLQRPDSQTVRSLVPPDILQNLPPKGSRARLDTHVFHKLYLRIQKKFGSVDAFINSI